MTDLELKRRVESKLNSMPDVNAAQIGIAAKDGLVLLTGSVESYWERTVAERTTFHVKGVRGVANALEILLAHEEKKCARRTRRQQ